VPDDILRLPWRVGRKLGRTFYAQIGERPSDADIFIGITDRPIWAEHLVARHNAHLEKRREARRTADNGRSNFADELDTPAFDRLEG
jgi:hypothetical protein